MCYDLPEVRRFDYFEPSSRGIRVQFRLIYSGSLPAEGASGGRAKEKQLIRKVFNKQLRELWQQHPDLRAQAETRYLIHTPHDDAGFPLGYRLITPVYPGNTVSPAAEKVKTWVEHIADDHKRCGGRFVPLVSKAGGFTCSLDILFLRRDNPGALVRHGGDIDNRVKVLLDGLRMPDTVSEMASMPFEADEDPFYCLLEDDALVTSVSVNTDRLLLPQGDGRLHDVHLVVCVTVNNPSQIFSGDRLV